MTDRAAADAATARVLAALDRFQQGGRTARFWLRDDDAVAPTAALDRYLALTSRAGVPVTLAVIPQDTGAALDVRLAGEADVTVALHGWSHVNHAGPGEKKQELGRHRPVDLVISELKAGFETLSDLHEDRFIPMLVPPWNRISPDILPHLQPLGLTCLSVFGPEKPGPLPQINTHVDVMDWHGTRGGRDAAVLLSEVALRLETMAEGQSVGILTHHLVHDAAVGVFLEQLVALTSGHAGCAWVSARDLMLDLQA